MIKIGIVGHRYLDQPQVVNYVTVQCINILKKMQAENNKIIALSAIAEGADTIFAEAALSLNIPIEIVRPFDEYINDFETETSQKRYQQLQNSALGETKLEFNTRSEDAYYAAMQWIIVNSDIVIAVWNGKISQGRGGTADAVNEVIRNQRDWIHIDVVNHCTTFHFKNS